MVSHVKNGYQKALLAGAIAGFVDGIVSFMATYFGSPVLGLFSTPPELWTSGYFAMLWILGAQIPYNMFWGVIFGLAFAMVYDRIPKKGAMKGLIFALIFYWLLSNLRNAQIMWTYGGAGPWPAVQFWVGFWASVAYGLTLGYLYKKE